tara:strand:- start:298 stop:489 length:192 start_codon:yes stop_codon:yes gene_type:complete
MTQEKKIYYSDLADYVDVCYSCKSQNIIHYNIETFNSKDSSFSVCNDCKSQDVGAVPPEEVLE